VPASVAIPLHVLIAAERFGAELTAGQVADAIAAGLRAGGAPEPDVIELDSAAELVAQLTRVRFEERMRAARAVVLATAELAERTLAGSAAFEVATRARQAGVPTYAITRENRLDAFDARILDLQLVIETEGRRGLRAAGRRLTPLLSAGNRDTRT
jgi:glycerate kinase